jgi:maltooligosyltrehalose trehalohydrolase
MPGEDTPLRRPLGAVPLDDETTEFRVWAPKAERVEVRLRSGDTHPLEPAGDGVHQVRVPARAGDDYLYLLDGGRELPDPCSRFQPEGIRGPSRVVDTSGFVWSDGEWEGLYLEELVVYELHVGTFSDEGTFEGVIPHLRELRALGVTAIELMPVGTFPGDRNWGYDGVFLSAPHAAYGGPEGLVRLVDAAHNAGLGVLMDVVYNHVGPGGKEIFEGFGPYFTGKYDTFWGDAINYDDEGSAGVREWAIQNAQLWIRDYHCDGLRLDAVHAVFDDSPQHVLAELAERVREVDRRALITSEMELGDRRPIEEWGHDAQWWDEFHHCLHVLLTGEHDGYYAPYGRIEQLARAYEAGPPERLIVCSQNHDQVGNRAVGDRLPLERRPLAALCTLFAPQTPLLFQGEDYGEVRPFQFFTDHIDPFIADATREGRRREFAGFAGFSAEDVPDPQEPATFERSKLSWESIGDMRQFYEKLLTLRRELPREVLVDFSEEGRWLTVRRGPVELVANFGDRQALVGETVVEPWSAVLR